MVATCGVGTMLYVLPMLLGRTYDVQNDTVGIDIYEKKDIDDAISNPFPIPVVSSNYVTISATNKKRDFLGISGELAVKISAGLLDIRGAGEYLKDTTNAGESVEVLIKMTFNTLIREISPDAKPMIYWELLNKKSVGTHVITSMTYGGEVYASVKFVALKSEYMEDIKAQVRASISEKGAFDIDAQGKLAKLAQNMSSQAKMEIDYYATVPLEGVPTTIEGLGKLVEGFKDQVQKVNKGAGVALCAGFRPLSDFNNKFSFLKNSDLVNALSDFNDRFDNLREAKSLLKTFVSSMPQTVSEDYLKKVIDFSGRLSKTLGVFHDVIGNMDLEKGSPQLAPAETAFDTNSHVSGFFRYTKEIRKIISESDSKVDPNTPRSVYVRWGKRSCGPKASNLLFIGFMMSFVEKGIGSGTNYLCLPENPNLEQDHGASGVNNRRSTITGARYQSFSVFHGEGKKIEGKVASCVVCETPMRPTVRLFTAALTCPGDWVQEYTGFLVSANRQKSRAEFVCVDADPDSYEEEEEAKEGDPVLLPVRRGDEDKEAAEAAVPCAVCSK